MEKKILFAFLILCAIASQGICTSLKENDKTSDLHIRNKRVVGRGAHISEASFLVALTQNGINHCPATLLTPNAGITAAECVKEPSLGGWQIQAGSTHHQVVKIIKYGVYNSELPAFNNLALVIFQPRIDYYTTHSRPLGIFNTTLSAQHDSLSIYNWAPERNSRLSSSDIQMVNVKLIEFYHCHNRYPNRVGPDNLCAKSVIRGEHCRKMDYGAPVVMNRQLVGIFATRGTRCADPEILTSVLSHSVKEWIRSNI